MLGDWKQIELASHGDDRGSLISVEAQRHIPFAVKRVYYIFGTKAGVRRGFHAHQNLKQLLIAASGSCKVEVDDGNKKANFKLSSPKQGLIINNLVWREMYDFSPDCVLLVLASEWFEEADYIRDYSQFKLAVERSR